MRKATLNLESLVCPTCMQKIETAAKTITGVDQNSVKVLFNASKLKVNFNEKQTSISKIKQTIEDLGYPVLNFKEKTL